MKKLLKVDLLIITISTFLGYWLINTIYINSDFLKRNYFINEDNDINDLIYSKVKFSEKANKINQNIFLINVGNAKREEIAEMIDVVAELRPKVIGLDIVFNSEKEEFNEHLNNTLKKNKSKLVLGGFFNYDSKGNLGEYVQTDTSYGKYLLTGYTNFVTLNNLGTVRKFAPFTIFQNENQISFSAQIVKKYSDKIFEQISKRKNKTEIINYKYTLNEFKVFEKDELLKKSFKVDLENKIILFGYIGATQNSHTLEDYHFTPMGVSDLYPDMPGIAIHANIISMIIESNYVNNIPSVLILFVSFLLCYFHLLIYLKFSKLWPLWFHLISKLIQFLTVVVLTMLSLVFYKYFSLKLDTAILVFPIALSVDLLYFGEEIAKWLYLRFGIRSYLQNGLNLSKNE